MKQIMALIALAAIVSLSSCNLDDVNPGRSFEKQLAIDIELIDEYLLENEIDAEIDASSGIRYVHNVIGEGMSPERGDLVAIKFNGELLDGSFFGEDSIGLTLSLSSPTIEVLQIIIPLMNVGGRTTIYSPSGYCFGKAAVTNAPANSIIIFEIELLAVIRSEADQLAVDESIINEFLTESDLVADVDESGIRFITILEGTGDSPLVTDVVTVKYKGTFLNGVQFDQSTTGVQFSLSGVIDAWKIMVPTMKVGGKIKIYAPSKYCYGPSGSFSIAPNTIMVFEIELVSIQ